MGKYLRGNITIAFDLVSSLPKTEINSSKAVYQSVN